MTSGPRSYANEAAEGLALIRRWADQRVEAGTDLGDVERELTRIAESLLNEFRAKHDPPGARYWERWVKNERVFFTTGPFAPSYQTEGAVELQRHEFLSRQGMYFGYEDSL